MSKARVGYRTCCVCHQVFPRQHMATLTHALCPACYRRVERYHRRPYRQPSADEREILKAIRDKLTLAFMKGDFDSYALALIKLQKLLDALRNLA
jgi:hypothetical protein